MQKIRLSKVGDPALKLPREANDAPKVGFLLADKSPARHKFRDNLMKKGARETRTTLVSSGPYVDETKSGMHGGTSSGQSQTQPRVQICLCSEMRELSCGGRICMCWWWWLAGVSSLVPVHPWSVSLLPPRPRRCATGHAHLGGTTRLNLAGHKSLSKMQGMCDNLTRTYRQIGQPVSAPCLQAALPRCSSQKAHHQLGRQSFFASLFFPLSEGSRWLE